MALKRIGRLLSPFSTANCNKLLTVFPFPKFIVGSYVWLSSRIRSILAVSDDIN